MEETIKPTFGQKHPLLKDALSLAGFIIAVVLGTVFLNTFVFRSYNVVGGSMENTLAEEDRVIVDRLSVSWAHFYGQEYLPKRGQVVVFANGDASGKLTCDAPKNVIDQYIIKRVIAFSGERVVVKDGVLTVYNEEYPDGHVYDEDWRVDENNGPKKDVSGEIDVVVPDGELFVSGDNREGTRSLDSRNGLGTVPLCRIIGPVVLRIFPFNQIRTF